jgi:hypothetical protein
MLWELIILGVGIGIAGGVLCIGLLIGGLLTYQVIIRNPQQRDGSSSEV